MGRTFLNDCLKHPGDIIKQKPFPSSMMVKETSGMIATARPKPALNGQAVRPPLGIPAVLPRMKDPERLPVMEKKLFNALQVQLRSVAENLKLPPHAIFSNATLFDLALYRPTTTASFLKIEGATKEKAQKYAQEFTVLIDKYATENGLATNIEPASKAESKVRITSRSHLLMRVKVFQSLLSAQQAEHLESWEMGMSVQEIAEFALINSVAVLDSLLSSMEIIGNRTRPHLLLRYWGRFGVSEDVYDDVAARIMLEKLDATRIDSAVFADAMQVPLQEMKLVLARMRMEQSLANQMNNATSLLKEDKSRKRYPSPMARQDSIFGNRRKKSAGGSKGKTIESGTVVRAKESAVTIEDWGNNGSQEPTSSQVLADAVGALNVGPVDTSTVMEFALFNGAFTKEICCEHFKNRCSEEEVMRLLKTLQENYVLYLNGNHFALL
ncbi:hypothetical protein HK101_001042 [Irineochytrium annulatum]|nr:hypothetical protein HK101_001042 [Irineochytrium annulatum]